MNVRILALFVSLIILLQAAANGEDWPMWRGNAARTGKVAGSIPANLSLSWTRQEQPLEQAWKNPINQKLMPFDRCYEPIVMGKTLYYGSSRTDRLVAVDTDSGGEKWSFFADGPIRFAPAGWKDKIFVCSDDGYLYCLNASNGKLIWKFLGGPSERKVIGNERLISMWPARGGPVVVDDKVYFAAGIWSFMGIFIHCLDAETGKVVWTNDGSGQVYLPQQHGGAVSFSGITPQGYLAAASGKLVIPGGRGTPGCVDLNTGKMLWYLPGKAHARGGTHVQIDGSKVINNGKAYNLSNGEPAGDGDSRITTITAGSETITPSKYRAQGTAGTILAGDGKVFVVGLQGAISCYASKGGGKRIAGTPQAPAPSNSAGKAGALLKAAGRSKGWAVVYGLASARLAGDLAAGTGMNVVVIDPDPDKVRKAREKINATGLYGKRYSIINADPMEATIPPYMATVIICEDLSSAGFSSAKDLVARAWYGLRPYGGTLCAPESAKAAFGKAGPNAKIGKAGSFATLTREGALEGAADWTHQYGDVGNSVMSKDKRVKLPLGLLWFGGSSHANILPRHGHGPTEQVIGGRLFIEGRNHIRAVDVYTGQVLWERELKNVGANYDYTSHEPGANSLGSNYASALDGIYVAHGEKCLKLDPATGKTAATFTLPDNRQFATIRVWEDLLIAAADPFAFNEFKDLGKNNWGGTCSRDLFVLDRNTGKVKWSATAGLAFHHNTIIIGKGTLYAIDRLPPKKQDALSRRGQHPKQLGMTYKIRAFNVRTGKGTWSTDKDVFGTWLGFSEENNILIQTGRPSRDMVSSEPGGRLIAYDAANGHSKLFDKKGGLKGGPMILYHDIIFTQDSGGGDGLDIRTGRGATHKHPITGGSDPWKFRRRYGCNSAIASEHLLTFRSGAAGYFDLTGNLGTGNFGGFKSGCTSSLVAADGVLNSPDYTRTCVCTYQNQASLALVHMPEVPIELWHETPSYLGGSVKRVGVNLNAPGDRIDDAGVMWLDAPSIGGRSPDLKVSIDGKTDSFRRHAASIGGEGLPWVAGSGVMASSVKVSMSGGGGYTVRLYFCEPEDLKPGDRVFDVTVNGGGGVRGLDIVKEAKGRLKALVKTVKGVNVSGGGITIGLKSKPGGKPALLSGIEIIGDGEKMTSLKANVGAAWEPVRPGKFVAKAAGKPAKRSTQTRRPTARPAAESGDVKAARDKLVDAIVKASAGKTPKVKINIGSRMYDAQVVKADKNYLTVNAMGAAMPLRWRTLKPEAMLSVAEAYKVDAKLIDAYRKAME